MFVIWVKTIKQAVALEEKMMFMSDNEFIEAIYLMLWGKKQRFQNTEKL